MKTWVMIPIIVLCMSQTSQSQNDSIKTKKIYRTWIKTYDAPHKMKGVIFEIKDSSITLVNPLKRLNFYQGNFDVPKVDVRNIDVIHIRKRNSTQTGFLIGIFSGALAGGIIGYVASKPLDESEGENWEVTFSRLGTFISTASTAVFGAALGVGIGIAVGSIRKTIKIHGNQQQFELEKQKLNSYSLTYDPVSEGKKQYSFSYLRETLRDFDGNVYRTIAIGAMVVMAENLRVIHFRNGTQIACVKDDSAWTSVPSAAYCNFRNDTGNVAVYGRLYNWQSISDTSGLCPKGWHIPSFVEWTSLFNCLGGCTNAGGYLKEPGNSHWRYPNRTHHSISSIALPSGSRDRDGTFSEPRRTCQWWVANGNDTENIQGLSLSNDNTRIMLSKPDKNSGLSVRCIRDH